jgi:hypothetical protein
MTMLPPKWVRHGFAAAGIFNFGIIVASRGFSDNLGRVDPLFSPAGCILICIWGAAYLSVSRRAHLVPALAAVFCVEKLFYVAAWIRGLTADPSPLAGHPDNVQFFFRSYGVGDLAFAILFAATWWRFRKGAPE